MKTIKNPKQKEIKVLCTCAIVSRKPEVKDNEYKTAVVGIYDTNNPHKSARFPRVIYEFTNIEKVRIKGLNLSYYTEGNDLIINDLEELFIIHEGSLVVLKGYQFEMERRKK